jgi:hypothetical protein
MEVRYLGFDQQQNARAYRFDVLEKGQPARSCIVTADLMLFHTHGVRIQEGPALCAGKLMADLERQFAGAHELTAEDLLSHVNACSLAEAKRAEARKAPRRHLSPGGQRSPWRNPGA